MKGTRKEFMKETVNEMERNRGRNFWTKLVGNWV